MIPDIITTIFNIVIALVLLLLKVILAPIDFLIAQALPQLDDAFNAVSYYITTILTNIGWFLSITGIPTAIIALVVAFWIFKLTVPLQIWLIKVAVSWYNALKP